MINLLPSSPPPTESLTLCLGDWFSFPLAHKEYQAWQQSLVSCWIALPLELENLVKSLTYIQMIIVQIAPA